MSFCVALEISGCCIKGSTTTDRRAHNGARGESRIDVGITSPEHRCSSSGPGDVHGIVLGIAGASPDVLAVVQMSVCRSWQSLAGFCVEGSTTTDILFCNVAR